MATTAAPEHVGYYGIPVIHRPHWKWLIIWYFYLGGISGAAYAVAAVSRLVGPVEDQRIVRVGRYLSLAALLPCPALLILDLGKPLRFLNMVKTVNPRSPMSLGSWDLLLYSGFSGLMALVQAANDGLLGHGAPARRLTRLPAGPLGSAGVAPALFLSGYGGVLLATTAVPLWAKSYRLLGPLFLTSAMANATAAMTLILTLAPGTAPATLHRLHQLETISGLTELALLAAARRHLGETARPLTEGRPGRLVRYGTVGGGIVTPLLLHAAGRLLGPERARLVSGVASTLVLAGGFTLRYAIVVGGHASADDPQATFQFTAKRP